MALRLGVPVIGVVDVVRAARFWSTALDLEVTPEREGENWRTLRRPGGGKRTLRLMRSDSPVEAHPRVHLDLFVDTAAEQRSEVARLVGLGARQIAWDSDPPDPGFVVLADPDGNPFCVVDLSHAPSGA